jgi:hypothetical protein
MKLAERLAYDFDSDFPRLLAEYLNNDEYDYVRGTAGLFELVGKRHPSYINHGPVLAVSMGGSSTKLAIGSLVDGSVRIEHAVAVKNPTSDMHLYDFLDGLLLRDPKVKSYLEDSARPSMCFTLPLMINERNIPFHPVKIAHIHGFIARNDAEMTDSMIFDGNIARYFKSRGLRAPLAYVQSDPVIAHLGGRSRIQLNHGDRTLLLVCGTGMATADNNVQRVISRLRMIDFDDELYPKDFTEGYVLESACSGKGIYDIMARAVRIREREEGSALAGQRADRFFSNLYDSVLVARIWESSLDPEPRNELVDAVRDGVSHEAFSEMQEIAGHIMHRAYGSLAGAILATAAKLDRREYVSKYYVIFEGSVALDPYVNRRIVRTVGDALARPSLFERLGVAPPNIDLSPRPYSPLKFGPLVPEALRKSVDITLAGTIAAAAANEVLASERSLKEKGDSH